MTLDIFYRHYLSGEVTKVTGILFGQFWLLTRYIVSNSNLIATIVFYMSLWRSREKKQDFAAVKHPNLGMETLVQSATLFCTEVHVKTINFISRTCSS